MILAVEVVDAQGDALPLSTGETLPAWTGDFSGTPGAYFAKILHDDWTGDYPSAAYWRDISLAEDTRLAAFETSVDEFAFARQGEGPYTVHVQLIYRRAYQELMEQKGWDDPDIVMEEMLIEVAP
jgi:hypothetical protein